MTTFRHLPNIAVGPDRTKGVHPARSATTASRAMTLCGLVDAESIAEDGVTCPSCQGAALLYVQLLNRARNAEDADVHFVDVAELKRWRSKRESVPYTRAIAKLKKQKPQGRERAPRYVAELECGHKTEPRMRRRFGASVRCKECKRHDQG